MRIESKNPYQNQAPQTSGAKTRGAKEAEVLDARKSMFPGSVDSGSVPVRSPMMGTGNDDANVTLSSAARDMARAKDVASSAPDRNMDAKIEDLRKRIASGDYEPDYDALADKMIKEHSDFGV